MKKRIEPKRKTRLPGFAVLSGFMGLLALLFSFSIHQPQPWVAPAAAVKVANPVPSDAKSLAAGKALYTKNCYNCHGQKGKGDGPKSADLEKSPRDFTKDDFQKQSDGSIFYKMTEGRKPMPSFKKDLTEEQRWQVINYVRSLKIKK